jgi:hypothetical protein
MTMGKKMQIALTVNGEAHELLAEPRELLIYVLRERLTNPAALVLRCAQDLGVWQSIVYVGCPGLGAPCVVVCTLEWERRVRVAHRVVRCAQTLLGGGV